MKDYKLGKKIKLDNEMLEVVMCKSGCDGCYFEFMRESITGACIGLTKHRLCCHHSNRDDYNDIIFKRIEQ